MDTLSYAHSVAAGLFQSEEERERAELQRIEGQRNERERLNGVAVRLARLMDALPAARAHASALCASVDSNCRKPSPGDYAEAIIRGDLIRGLADNMAAHDALAERATDIKREIEARVVGVAQAALDKFRRENSADIKKLPPLKKVAAPNFVPSKPVNDDERPPNLPSPGVRAMLGLKPGEVIPPPAWETPDRGTITVNNLDED